MRGETYCCHVMSYYFQLVARDLLNPVLEHWLEQEISRWVHHEGLIQQPIAPGLLTHYRDTIHPMSTTKNTKYGVSCLTGPEFQGTLCFGSGM